MRTPAEIATAFAPSERLTGHSPFFLVGIGGAGMSALAVMLHRRGIPVSGSDSTASSVTSDLQGAGIEVRIGHGGEGIRPGDQVVLSDAIDLESSPEVAAARALGNPLFRRSQLLNWLLRDKKIIAVTGTHGKTTVTGMIGAGLRAAGMDPSIVVGAYVPEFDGSVIEGNGEYAVVEACEAYNALLDIDPYVAVLTNLEPDHLDFHGTFDNLRGVVQDFLSRVPTDGQALYCRADEGARRLGEEIAGAISYEASGEKPTLPGEHNAQNAAGAYCACVLVGADPELAYEGVMAFRGAERRLQEIRDGLIAVVDDYAHHPTEVEASIRALREKYPGRRIVVAFQPHLYSRTAANIGAFAKALDLADRVVLTDIYPAREPCLPGVSSARIAEAMKQPADYVPARQLLARHLADRAEEGDVLCLMGAGNIGLIGEDLVFELDDRESGRPIRVAVILGGDSAEREVSLLSGQAILAALKRLGYDAFPVDMTYTLFGHGELGDFTGPGRPDLAFLAVHGTHAEDGAIQGLFELMHLPYTGSGILASALCMDKEKTKEVLGSHGLPVPRGQRVFSKDDPLDVPLPVIVKPNAQGSTVGLSYVKRHEELGPAIERALRYDTAALVEEWVEGMEISVPVLGGRALPAVEICPDSGQYDFASKYTPGATEEICPARLPAEVAGRAQRFAEQAHFALGCRGATRTDFIVRDGVEPVILEVNTLPGMTGTSLLPKSAQTAGLSFDALVDWLVKEGLRSHAATP